MYFWKFFDFYLYLVFEVFGEFDNWYELLIFSLNVILGVRFVI